MPRIRTTLTLSDSVHETIQFECIVKRVPVASTIGLILERSVKPLLPHEKLKLNMARKKLTNKTK